MARSSLERLSIEIGFVEQRKPMGAFLCEDMTVSAGEDDRESGKPTTDFAAQRDPIHARHHHIAEDQVNLPRLFLKQLQRRLGVSN